MVKRLKKISDRLLVWEDAEQMRYKHYLIILALLVITFFVYNLQLASIPLLILSLYLFYVTYNEFVKLKNKK